MDEASGGGALLAQQQPGEDEPCERGGERKKFEDRHVRRKIRRQPPDCGEQEGKQDGVLGLRDFAGEADNAIAFAFGQCLGGHHVDAVVVIGARGGSAPGDKVGGEESGGGRHEERVTRGGHCGKPRSGGRASGRRRWFRRAVRFSRNRCAPVHGPTEDIRVLRGRFP